MYSNIGLTCRETLPLSQVDGSRSLNRAAGLSLSESVNSFLSSVINKYSGQGQALIVQNNQVGMLVFKWFRSWGGSMVLAHQAVNPGSNPASLQPEGKCQFLAGKPAGMA